MFINCFLFSQNTSFPGSVTIPPGANNSYRAGNYVSIGNMVWGNEPYISFNAILTTSDLQTGINSFTPAYNPGGGLIIAGDAGNSGLHFLQKNYSNGTPPYNMNSFSENLTLNAAGNVGIGTAAPNAKLSFGTNVGYPLIHFFEGGVGGRYGMGIQPSELQMFVPSGFGHFSWSKGGDLQGTGTNELMRLMASGALCIGTANPGTMKLAVEGNIGARKIIVTQTNPFPDYVFKPKYKLRTLKELEVYIKEYNHLPDVPSAKEVKKQGLDLGDTQAALLRKIEELTLYVLQQNREMKTVKKEIATLKSKKK